MPFKFWWVVGRGILTEALIFDAEGPFTGRKKYEAPEWVQNVLAAEAFGRGEDIFCLDQFTHQKSEVLLGGGGVVAYYFLHPKSGKEYNCTNLDWQSPVKCDFLLI